MCLDACQIWLTPSNLCPVTRASARRPAVSQVLAEAQGVTEAWPPGGMLPVAQRLVCGGEAAALPALRAYLRCRQRPGRSTPGPPGLPGAPGRCVPASVNSLQHHNLACLRRLSVCGVEQPKWSMVAACNAWRGLHCPLA